jgi:FkbM family methyltransferase
MIIDSFPFFNELDLCTVRLNYLEKAVDAFVITESNLTWRCRPNERKFDDCYKHLDKKIKNKIHYEFIEYDDNYVNSEEHTNKKTIQNLSRDRLVEISRSIAKDDDCIFFYSDLDEIWDRRGLKEIKDTLTDTNQIVCNMDMRIVYVDWYTRQRDWPGTRITMLNNLKGSSPLSEGSFKYSKSGAFKRYEVINNGWHFTYFGNQEQRSEKIKNIKNGMDWEQRTNLSYNQIADQVNTLSEWNKVARKKKIQGRQLLQSLKSGDWWICDEEQNMMKFTEKAKRGDLSWQGRFPEYLLKFVKEPKIFVDVGANYGFMSTALSTVFEQVHAFEVIPKTYDCLVENIKGFDNITAYPCGLGDKKGTMLAKRRLKTAGHSQIVNDPEQIALYRQRRHPKQHMVELFEIPIKPLDSFKFERIDLLKIDVEGFEEYVLKGAINTLTNCNPVVALEITREKKTTVIRTMDCIEFMISLGYKLIDQRKDDFILVRES